MNPIPGTRPGAIPGVLPVTPSNKRSLAHNAVEKVILRLNNVYGLGVTIPNPTLSPSKRKQLSAKDEQFARCDKICRGIQFLFYQRGETLEQALESFDQAAKAASLRWVPKSRADPTTLPSVSAPPKAQTPAQRLNLQSVLIKVIENVTAQKKPPLLLPKPGGRTNNDGPAPFPTLSDESDTGSSRSLPESPASLGSKRSFDRDDDHVGKRSRGLSPCPSPTSSAFTDALDKVPARRRLGHPPENWSPERCRPAPQRRNSSDSTPTSSRVSSLFSNGEQQSTQQSTQTTLDGDLREENASLDFAIPARPASQQFKIPDRTSAAVNRPPIEAPVTGTSHQPPPQSSGVFSDIDFPDSNPLVLDDTTILARRTGFDSVLSNGRLSPLESRLQNIWPTFPRWLHGAPLAVAWEITRICLHCKVDLNNDALKYDPTWATSDMFAIWRDLSQLDVFRGKSFPERPSAEAFSVALNSWEGRGNIVVMSAALEFNPDKTGPLFLLDMKPLRFDESCRLTRRFGPDRFLEILIPSPAAMNTPSHLQAALKDGGADQVIQWLTKNQHCLAGRRWQAFYSKDAGYRKPAKDLRLGPEAKATFKERVHFFAEDGLNFRQAEIRSRLDIPHDTVQQRTRIPVSLMMDWLLQLERNEAQPHLKLFSRIQLGLSKTFPALTFEPDQIRHHAEDVLSPIGKVMNDGIGRMSRSVARKIRDALGLSDIPSAVQGRMGSAKGMWLMDVADTGDADWIETYPSQRKWDCDYADRYHRTLEVRSVASELKPAGLNLQFLPVLEDRAKDKRQMRLVIGNRLTNDLEKQFQNQKTALQRPLQFRQWVSENSNNRSERVRHGQVLFLAGLPESKSEILSFLLNSGFDPKAQKYLQDLAWDLQKQKCDILRTKLNIRVGRSAYIYMVVDFWGVLKENEVHVGFSSKFRDEVDDISYTLLADCDVLVARSPAHFVSDVQKVRAVFKPELHALKDVIVFPRKGNIPLADKLSGGDYDGDMAWVCWDPDIVENFVNADVPEQPDLSAYLGQDKTSFRELVCHTGLSGPAARYEAVYDMINKSFLFAMQPNYLGICTNYKEKACYHSKSVSDKVAVLLSTLVGKLVDQSKQGIIFDNDSWSRLRRDHFNGRMAFDDPAYKGDIWVGTGEPRHVIDYLKFSIAKPAIDRELASFHKVMAAEKGSTAESSENAAQFWDRDLVVYYEDFNSIAEKSASSKRFLESLRNSLGAVKQEWTRAMQARDGAYPDKVKQIYEKWLAIDAQSVSRTGSNTLDSRMLVLLEPPALAGRGAGATTYFSLLKASLAFKLYHHSSPKFVWQMAGYQLAFIKAQVTSGVGGMPLLLVPLMYAGLGPDGRFVKQFVARLEGDGSEYPDLDGLEDGDGGAERGDDID
ncbi:hypothetical protein N657DRAFT_685133 [Parathielavia appendiculata]|uniref:RNA-dependent RNA polymerase n=1 Tax=Parathielavia appendiculata TaxID=2587402 RepID=A0AAN6TR51_9PEZI|nr:hypothetical protein N657DRAFT_685133 [Parathielavia appendiculata]